MTKMRRILPRYIVRNLPELRGELKGLDDHFQLMTLSPGGCGFMAPLSSDPLIPPAKVICRFEMESDSGLKVLQLEGNAIYATPANGFVPSVFYGIRFSQPSPELFQWCRTLERLVPTGLVSTA